MTRKSTSREELFKVVFDWTETTRDIRDHLPYTLILKEILFHTDVRFHEYVQYVYVHF